MSKTTRFNPDNLKASFHTIDLDKLDQRLKAAIELRLTSKFARTLTRFAQENAAIAQNSTIQHPKAA